MSKTACLRRLAIAALGTAGLLLFLSEPVPGPSYMGRLLLSKAAAAALLLCAAALYSKWEGEGRRR